MRKNRNGAKAVLFFGSIFLFIFIAGTATTFGETNGGTQEPVWVRALPARCNDPSNCETSSPVIANILGDSKPEIIVGTSNGHLVAVDSNGNVLWDKDTAAHFGMAANTQQINSSPAVADINNDGHPEIVVGTGSKSSNFCTQGGVIAYDRNGNFLWRFLAQDEFTEPSGCRDTIFSTPALGDLDKDGDMEIVVGGFDKRIYVLRHDGTLFPNFPIDSSHAERFPTWDGLTGHLADTIWGSASLADMNADGYLDILISTDEGDFDNSFPNGLDWECPYTIPPHPWPQDYCGGALYVIDRFGNHLPGFPKRIHEIMQSSPAIADTHGDGRPEIFVGGGTFYYNASPDNPTIDFRIYGWDSEGNELPGWAGGKVTGGSTPASPAIGDIAGDSGLEIVAVSMDKKLYAWHANGTAVAGFPMEPKNQFGVSNTFDVGLGPILADYDNDNKMEIFVRTGPNVTVVDGNGTQLTATQNPPNTTSFYAERAMQNNPAVGDMDNDGDLELVAFNRELFLWDMPGAGTEADWPMFRFNAARTGHPSVPMLNVTPSSVFMFHEIGDSTDVEFTVQVAGNGLADIDWSASGSSGVSASPNSGQVDGAPTAVTVTIDRGSLNNGQNNKTLTFTGEVDGNAVVNSPLQVPITIYLVEEVFNVYLPAAIK